MICCINVLEVCGTYSDMIVARSRTAKMSNKFAGGNISDTVQFVAKSLPCTCPKKLHCAARMKVSKVGTCWGVAVSEVAIVRLLVFTTFTTVRESAEERINLATRQPKAMGYLGEVEREDYSNLRLIRLICFCAC